MELKIEVSEVLERVSQPDGKPPVLRTGGVIVAVIPRDEFASCSDTWKKMYVEPILHAVDSKKKKRES